MLQVNDLRFPLFFIVLSAVFPCYLLAFSLIICYRPGNHIKLVSTASEKISKYVLKCSLLNKVSLGDKAHIYIVSSEASDAFSLIICLMLLITENGRQNPHGTVKLTGGRRGNTSYRTNIIWHVVELW